MDSYPASDVARRLGTTIPRVMRAARELGILGHEHSGRKNFTREQLIELASVLGISPEISGLSRTEAQVLAALARAPLGLASVRIVARRAGISPTTASAALDRLISRGLVLVEAEPLSVRGPVEDVRVFQANRTSPDWPQLSSQLAYVRPAQRQRKLHSRDREVPKRLRYLFWNTAPQQLDPSTSGHYIADRLLSTHDPEGLAWGVRNLRSSDWRRVARARGLTPDLRQLALNFAAATERENDAS